MMYVLKCVILLLALKRVFLRREPLFKQCLHSPLPESCWLWHLYQPALSAPALSALSAPALSAPAFSAPALSASPVAGHNTTFFPNPCR